MSADSPPPTRHKPDLTESTATIPSDSEKYSSSQNDLSPSPEPPEPREPRQEERKKPLILYSPPTVWSFLRGAAINMLLPFVNGLMLGFGELFAHEAAFRLGWSNTRIFPEHRRNAHAMGPGIEVRDDPTERRRQSGSQRELDDLTTLE